MTRRNSKGVYVPNNAVTPTLHLPLQIAKIDSNARQAFLNFKKDGLVKIVIRSGNNVILRMRAISNTFDDEGKTAWQVKVVRENDKGEAINMHGKTL